MIKRRLEFDILDSMRGIAAFYVTIAHCRGSLWMGGNEFLKQHPRDTWSMADYLVFGSSMLTRLAVEFVIVFFLLSGFSIAHSLAGKTDVLGFYKRRLVRIYPPYLTALVWAGVVFLVTRAVFNQWYDGSYTEFSFIRTIQMNDYFEWNNLLGSLLYMPGEGFITPFWSLTFEVIFYLLAPFLLRRVHAYLLISFILWSANLIVPGLISQLQLPKIIFEYLFVYNVFFAAGVFLYNYWDQVMVLAKKLSKWQHLFLLAIALGAMFGVNLIMQHETAYSFLSAGIFAFVLIVYFLRFEVRIPWLMRMGAFSYTLYITHLASIYLYLAIFWVISGYRGVYISNYLVWMGAVPFCVLVAYLQYRLIESRSKQKLQKMRTTQLKSA